MKKKIYPVEMEINIFKYLKHIIPQKNSSIIHLILNQPVIYPINCNYMYFLLFLSETRAAFNA